MIDSALLTDLYELHMMQSYHALDMHEEAVFDLTVRTLPDQRNFLVAAGLEQVLDYLAGLHFTQEELAWLATTGRFSGDFLASLASLRFTGSVDALPEGTVFFAGSPVLRVRAPIAQAQLAESRIINLMQFPILVASKAVRCVMAAQGREVVDFGLRRAHGGEAALLAARASYLAGFSATATVLAGKQWGIPVAGTLAHAFIQAHDSEEAAFSAFARTCRGPCTLLVDTYDVPRALASVVRLAGRLRRDGQGRIGAVRIDSGDLDGLARLARGVLDAGGCGDIRIVTSGDLDEYRIAALVKQGAPVDLFGVGTRVSTSADAPFLDCAYKLAEYAGKGRRKRSPGKQSWPGRKQLFRRLGADGFILHDTLGLEGEAAGGRPLLEAVMRDGRRVGPQAALADLRQHLRAQLATLAPALHGRARAPAPPLLHSPGLLHLGAQVDLECR